MRETPEVLLTYLIIIHNILPLKLDRDPNPFVCVNRLFEMYITRQPFHIRGRMNTPSRIAPHVENMVWKACSTLCIPKLSNLVIVT